MNEAKLEYEMKIRGVTTTAICSELGISRSAFYRKKKGVSQFTQKEIAGIVRILNLESPMGIFFDDKVS